MLGSTVLKVCSAAWTFFACAAALSRLSVESQATSSIHDQLRALNRAFADESHRDIFARAFDGAMVESALSSVPEKDTSNGPQSIMFESALRRKMLEETTRLVHALEVGKQTGLLNYRDAPEMRSFNAAEAEDLARDIVTRLADSLIRSDSRFNQWMSGVASFYTKGVKKIINEVELLISASPESKAEALGELAASVSVLLNTVLERSVYSSDQIAESFKSSELQSFLDRLNVAVDLRVQ